MLDDRKEIGELPDSIICTLTEDCFRIIRKKYRSIAEKSKVIFFKEISVVYMITYYIIIESTTAMRMDIHYTSDICIIYSPDI